jgi:hypothetical protein
LYGVLPHRKERKLKKRKERMKGWIKNIGTKEELTGLSCTGLFNPSIQAVPSNLELETVHVQVLDWKLLCCLSASLRNLR